MTKLSSSVDIEKLSKFLEDKNQNKIADFVFERFSERYINPIKKLDPNEKHGFSIMAISCLMIESLESFKSGFKDTKKKSKKTFIKFLKTELEFKDFSGFEESFYTDIRCGILHQSETTNGWKIRRTGKLFDNKTKTINATKFLEKLEKTLKNYTTELKTNDWNSVNWKNLIKKLNSIINNC
jgi:hypothetical protein